MTLHVQATRLPLQLRGYSFFYSRTVRWVELNVGVDDSSKKGSAASSRFVPEPHASALQGGGRERRFGGGIAGELCEKLSGSPIYDVAGQEVCGDLSDAGLFGVEGRKRFPGRA